MPKSFTFAFPLAFPLATDPDDTPAAVPAWYRLVVPPDIRDDEAAFDRWQADVDAAHAAADAAMIATLDSCEDLIGECREVVRVLAGKPSEAC